MNPQTALKPDSAAAPMAAPLKAFYTALNQAGILWCSWKSNRHMDAALHGDTDSDLLFPEEKKSQIEDIFHKSGFRLPKTAWFRTFPGMVDAFALDPENGNLIHVHCHFRLTLGEKYLKSYELPWREELLQRRAMIPGRPVIYTSDPVDELVLLLLRHALKITWVDRLRKKNKIDPEFHWLKERVSTTQLEERASQLLTPVCADFMKDLYAGNELDFKILLDLNMAAQEVMNARGWRRTGEVRAVTEQMLRRMLSYAAGAQAYFNILFPYFRRRRTFEPHGLIVAILGADGSGKSTVVKETRKAWRRKIDVSRIYFGRTKFLSRFWKKTPKDKNENKIGEQNTWFFILRAVFDAGKKRLLLWRAKSLRKKGVIVLCDRFPQNQTMGFNDGPLLSHLIEDENSYRRILARWEAAQFSAMEKYVPDLVIRLVPPLEIALARKPGENTAEFVKQKMEALQNLRFPETVTIHTVDAGKPLSEVLREARNLIWNALPS